MNITARARAALKRFALALGLGVAVLAVALGGAGFLTAAYYLHFAQKMPPDRAAALTGATLLAAAVLVALLGAVILKRSRRPQPGWLSDFTGLAGLAVRLAAMTIRRDPKKALVIAAVSGVLVELLFGDGKKEK
jgi:uncharacterized membrane protein YfcA